MCVCGVPGFDLRSTHVRVQYLNMCSQSLYGTFLRSRIRTSGLVSGGCQTCWAGSKHGAASRRPHNSSATRQNELDAAQEERPCVVVVALLLCFQASVSASPFPFRKVFRFLAVIAIVVEG